MTDTPAIVRFLPVGAADARMEPATVPVVVAPQRKKSHETTGDAAMFEGLAALVVLILDIYAIAKVIGSGASTREKTLWVIAIFILPVLGYIAWLLFGPSGLRYRRA
ncbi:MAG: PLD nuclease N-terminal domain-containing protein [Alphaproteobacteria bacterium]